MDEIEIRPADVEHDAASIGSLDASFETTAILEVQGDSRGFSLVETTVEPPVRKTFDLRGLDPREWERVWLAVDAGHAAGVVATQYDDWNGRLIIRHLYVDAACRRRGIGGRLLDAALSDGERRGARTAWLETSNVNLPSVRAYERRGFTLCGLDTSLYDGTPSEGEVALFLCRRLTATAR